MGLIFDTQHNDTLSIKELNDECRYAEFCVFSYYAECSYAEYRVVL
jgi:hypothetical protein